MLLVKGWQSFQSYKDRKPPWVRLHKTLLDNFEFHGMSANARALLPMLWLLASEDIDPISGLIRDSYEKISFRLRMAKSEVEAGITECVNAGFLEILDEHGQIVTGQLRDCHAAVTPETETETETEKKKKTKKEKSYSPAFLDLWQSWKPFEMDSGSKSDAFQSYEKATISGITHERVKTAAHAYCAQCFRNKSKTKHLVTWLNQKGWESHEPQLFAAAQAQDDYEQRKRYAIASGRYTAAEFDRKYGPPPGHGQPIRPVPGNLS